MLQPQHATQLMLNTVLSSSSCMLVFILVEMVVREFEYFNPVLVFGLWQAYHATGCFPAEAGVGWPYCGIAACTACMVSRPRK